MTTLNLILLIALGLAFLAWAAAMAHMLLVLSARARETFPGGGFFRRTGHNLRTFATAIRSPGDGPVRRRILWLSALLFAIIILRVVLLTRAA